MGGGRILWFSVGRDNGPTRASCQLSCCCLSRQHRAVERLHKSLAPLFASCVVSDRHLHLSELQRPFYGEGRRPRWSYISGKFQNVVTSPTEGKGESFLFSPRIFPPFPPHLPSCFFLFYSFFSHSFFPLFFNVPRFEVTACSNWNEYLKYLKLFWVEARKIICYELWPFCCILRQKDLRIPLHHLSSVLRAVCVQVPFLEKSPPPSWRFR